MMYFLMAPCSFPTMAILGLIWGHCARAQEIKKKWGRRKCLEILRAEYSANAGKLSKKHAMSEHTNRQKCKKIQI